MGERLPIWKIGQWNHICFIGTSKGMVTKIILNGETINEGMYKLRSQDRNYTNLIFMGIKDYEYSFYGEMTDINIWNRSFTEKEINDWTECRMKKGGNIVDWRTASWIPVGLDEKLLEKEAICMVENRSYLLGSDVKKNFQDTNIFCGDVLGGEMAIVIDNVTAQEMVAIITNAGLEKCGTKFYSGTQTGMRKACL